MISRSGKGNFLKDHYDWLVAIVGVVALAAAAAFYFMAAGEDPEAGLVGLGSFDVIVSWVDDLSAGLGTNHTITLKDCFFNEDGLEANQDDTNLIKELELNPFRIVNAII